MSRSYKVTVPIADDLPDLSVIVLGDVRASGGEEALCLAMCHVQTYYEIDYDRGASVELD